MRAYKKLIIALTISVLVLTLFIGAVVFPLIDKIKENSKTYLSNQETLSKLDYKESLLKEVERYYQEKQDDLSVIEGVFLSEQEAVGFISTLETIAEQTGNVFEIKTASSFTPSAEKEESFLALRISLWGDYEDLLSFVANLEDSPYSPYRLIEIDSINIKRLDEMNLSSLGSNLREGDLETVLGIKIYTQPND